MNDSDRHSSIAGCWPEMRARLVRAFSYREYVLCAEAVVGYSMVKSTTGPP